MIIPSFSNFASTPNAGAAFVGGAGVGQRMVEARMEQQTAMAGIAQRAAEANMEAQLGMQRIQAEREQAEMQSMARQQALQQEVLQQAQKLEVEKAYQNSMIGLKQQELARQKMESDLKIQQAAKQFESQQRLVQHAQNALATGQASNEAEAFQQAALQFGLESGFSGGEMARAMESGEGGGASGMGPAQLQPVEGTDEYDFFQTGPNSRQLVKRTPEVPDDVKQIPGTGYQRIGEKLVPKREDAGIRQLREDRKRLKDALEGRDTLRHRMAMAKAAEPDAKVSASDKYYINQYKEMQKQLADIEAQLGRGSSGQSATNRIKILNIRKKE